MRAGRPPAEHAFLCMPLKRLLGMPAARRRRPACTGTSNCCMSERCWAARSKNKMSCVHRDLKPANLMLGGIPHDSTDLRLGGELGVIKIAGRPPDALAAAARLACLQGTCLMTRADRRL